MAGAGWTWDETLYRGSASYYAAGRMPYPPALAEALRRELSLNGTQRLLDVGCGPGSLTILLAPLVALAVGVDADQGMLDVAARSGAPNVRWRHLRAEALPADLGEFDVVTFAQSLHWMDRASVAAAVRGMLASDGALVHVQATTHRGDESDDPLPRPRPPHAAIAELVASYLGPVRRAGGGTLPGGTPAGEDEILRAAGLDGPRPVRVEAGEVVTRTADEVVAATFSLSSSTPHQFGARRPEFERDLRGLLRRVAPDDLFAERRRDIVANVWRPRGHGS